MHASASKEPWRLDRSHPILPGESYNGYVSRVAAAEGHPHTFELHRIAGLEWPQRTELGPTCLDGMPALAETLRIDPAELLVRAHAMLPDKGRSWRGAPLERYILELGTRRFSPASLARSDHHRALWCLRPFPFCEESWEYLVDRCPSPHCGVIQRWYYPVGVSLCDRCGESLAGADTTEVDPTLRGRLRLAVGLLHHDARRFAESTAALPDEVRALPPGGAFALLLALARVAEPALASRRRTIDAGVDHAVLARAVADGWTLLSGWPGEFERLATRRLAERGSRHGDGNRGATLGFLLRDWHVAAPGVTPLVTALRARFEGNARTCPNMATVLRASGTKPRNLARMRREGRVETVFALDGNHVVPLVSLESARTLSAARRGSELPEEVATRLGLPVYGVEQACSLGVLEWMEDPLPCAVRGGVRIPTTSIERFRTDAAAIVVPMPSDALPLDRVMLGVGGGRKPWGPMLRALLGGLVRCGLSDDAARPLLRRLLVHPADVQVVRSLAAASPAYDAAFPFRCNVTRGEAAEVLNLKASDAVDALARWPAVSSGRPVVPVEELERLAASRVSASELAESFRLKTFGARRVLERADVPRDAAGFHRPPAVALLSAALAAGGIEPLADIIGEKPSVVRRLLRRVDVRYRPAGRLAAEKRSRIAGGDQPSDTDPPAPPRPRTRVHDRTSQANAVT